VTIDNGKSKLEHGLVSVFLVGLAFYIRNGLLNNLLLIEVFPHWFKVAFSIILDGVLLAQNSLEIRKEVFDKNLARLGVSQMHSLRVHGCKEGSPVNNNNNNDERRQLLAFRFLDKESASPVLGY
jgi:hypothetical protein